MRIVIFKYLYIGLMTTIILLTGGCGYHMGSLMHPQVKTIAVAPVTNETLAYNAAAQMRGMLTEQFMVDGSLQVKDEKTADCILYAIINKAEFTEVTDASYDNNVVFRPAEWRVNLDVEFTVIIPGRKEPLVAKRTVTGTTIFQVQADMDTNRRRAILMACRDAAQKVVDYTTEAW